LSRRATRWLERQVPISPRLRPDFRKWSLIGRDFVPLRETLWPNETKAAAKSSLISANPARTDGGGQPPRIFDKGSEQQKEERAEFAGIDCSM